MAKGNEPIRDDLDAPRAFAPGPTESGWADFVSRAVSEQLACEDDVAFQSEITARIERGMADADAGRVRDAREAMREIAETYGLKVMG